MHSLNFGPKLRYRPNVGPKKGVKNRNLKASSNFIVYKSQRKPNLGGTGTGNSWQMISLNYLLQN